MGDNDPNIELIPAIILHPSGVVMAEAVGAARSIALKPVPLAIHQPKRPKAATGIVKPFTVKIQRMLRG